jgi:hypothetical protein
MMRAHLDTLKQLTEGEGRDFSALTISCKAPLYDTGFASPDGSRRPFSGEPEDIAGDIQTFAAIGVHELIFDCRGQSITESIERLHWFATDVIPGGGKPNALREPPLSLGRDGSVARTDTLLLRCIQMMQYQYNRLARPSAGHPRKPAGRVLWLVGGRAKPGHDD